MKMFVTLTIALICLVALSACGESTAEVFPDANDAVAIKGNSDELNTQTVTSEHDFVDGVRVLSPNGQTKYAISIDQDWINNNRVRVGAKQVFAPDNELLTYAEAEQFCGNNSDTCITAVEEYVSLIQQELAEVGIDQCPGPAGIGGAALASQGSQTQLLETQALPRELRIIASAGVNGALIGVGTYLVSLNEGVWEKGLSAAGYGVLGYFINDFMSAFASANYESDGLNKTHLAALLGGLNQLFFFVDSYINPAIAQSGVCPAPATVLDLMERGELPR